jgi:hypothetical protein
VLVRSFNVRETSPFTFSYNSFKGTPGFSVVGKNKAERYGDDEDLHSFTADFELWQVARATSAAPTSFPGECHVSGAHILPR